MMWWSTVKPFAAMTVLTFVTPVVAGLLASLGLGGLGPALALVIAVAYFALSSLFLAATTIFLGSRDWNLALACGLLPAMAIWSLYRPGLMLWLFMATMPPAVLDS